MPHYPPFRFLLPACWILACPLSKGVETLPPGGSASYNTSNNISLSLASWSSGWGSGNPYTGWDYVGNINRGSGVYLGNGWVLTAQHVGFGNFNLGGFTYNYAGYNYSTFTTTVGTNSYYADLNLFRIETISTTGKALNMPALTLASSAPVFFGNTTRANQLSQSQAVMIGYGGPSGVGNKSWGIDHVTGINQAVSVLTYTSADFSTAYGAMTNSRNVSVTNSAQLVPGDSGGGDFMNVSGSWQLAGVNEAVDGNGNSYMVEVAYYDAQIQAVMAAVPESGSGVLVLGGLGGVIAAARLRNRRRQDKRRCGRTTISWPRCVRRLRSPSPGY
jgi:hypothetical protein